MAGYRLLGLTGWMPVVVAIAACAGAGGINKDSPPDVKAAVVKERAQARWEALIKGDLDAAYTYLSPASKAATSIQSYKGQIKPGLWREVKVVGVDCDAELCVAKLLLNYDVPRGPKSPKAVSGIETPLTERWVVENGSAWYVYR